MDCFTSFPIEYRQVLVTAIDATRAFCYPILAIVGNLNLIISSSLVHVVSLTVFRTRSRLAHHFRLSVTVVVVDLELRVMGAGTDVLP